MEFVFKKDDVRKLLDADPMLDLVVVKLSFAHAPEGKFSAAVNAWCEELGKPGNQNAAALTIDGCPRPPGCG